MKKIILLLSSCIICVSLCGCSFVPGVKKTDNLRFTKTTVTDDPNCAIIIKSIDPNGARGYTLNAHLENKSIDKTYTFAVDDAYVNGVHCDPIFTDKVDAGQETDVNISFPTDALEEYDLGTVTDMELFISVYDANDIKAEPIFKDSIHIYPYGEQNAAVFKREAEPEDQILLDNKYVTVILTDYDEDEAWGYAAELYLLNKSNRHLLLSANDVYVNNCACEPYFAKTLRAGKSAFAKMTWAKSEFEEFDLNINDVNKIEFKLKINDYNDPTSTAFVNENISLRP